MTRRLVLPFVLLIALLVWAVYARDPRSASALRDLERVRPERAFPARLSVTTGYRPCTRVKLPADSTVPREDCGETADMPLEVEHLTAAGESLAPDSLQASALTAVLWWDRQPASLDSMILRLSEALRLKGGSVPLLVDLSAVHLFRAQQTQNQRDLFESLNYARDALDIEPRNLAALFNAALASEALYLPASADAAWGAYLAVDSTSPWADEARQRRRALLEQPSIPAGPSVSSSVKEVEAYAARYPQEAREQGWHAVLGAWGTAVLGGSAPRADSLLTLASRLGTALASRPGGDASLADAVEAIRRARGDSAATRTLAEAHAAYAHGQAIFNLEREAALESFDRVLNFQPPSTVLVFWAKVFGAGVEAYLRPGDPLDAGYRAMLADIDTIRYPSLAARIHWTWGKYLFGAGDFAGAQVHYAQSSRTYDRLDERENYGALRSMEGSAAYEQGDTLAGYRMAHQAAAALRPYRRSLRLHNVMLDLATYAARDGMPSAALVVQDEGVAVARQVSAVPLTLPEALLSRAKFYAAKGDTRRADADLRSAAMLFDSLNDSSQAELLIHTRAVIGNRPAAEVDAAVEYFSRDKRNRLWQMAALVSRADLRLARRDLPGAGADLDSITAQIARMSERGKDYHLRSALIEQARSRFDQLVMLHVSAGRPREALQALERGRVSFVHGTASRPSPGDRLRGPEGKVVLEYALIGDRLLAWTVRGDSVTLDQSVVDRDSLVFAIERVGRALEEGRDAQPLLERLHEWLMRPVLKHLPASAPLFIVADGEIGRVPFAALRDPRTRKDLLDTRTLSLASRLADVGRPEPAVGRSAPRALLVADPEFNQREHSKLDPLDGAHVEMEALRRLFYPGADTLSGRNVSIDAFRERARNADVIHYAGHAVFDDTRPERSFLVLAGKERLTADSITRWELGGVRLVVLSACSTIRARHGRSGGFAGLSGAFLSAGADGVVGSLWTVSDSLAQPLMEAFHREYQVSRDPADALRKAQLEMRRLKHPPAAWAGFRYVGG
jgi:tetratricopeptide (TPR) repeat protein